MSFDLVEILKIGGPLFTFAVLIAYLQDRHLRSLIKLLGNHLTHVEQKMDNVATQVGRSNASLDNLVRRIDQLLLTKRD